MHHGYIVCLALVFVIASGVRVCAGGESVYLEAPDDPAAVLLTADAFGVRGDGVHDDTAGVQAAIDRAGGGRGGGVVFVPAGVYRLSGTIYVWPGVRVIGFGAQRPVLKLGARTAGFEGGEDRYLVYFSGGRGREPGDPPRDGNPGTFYSALSNIDIEIGEGNRAAVGVRFHVAQHCYLSHMDLRLGEARAGLVDIGNIVEDVRLFGGAYGIDSHRSAPGWPIVVVDCVFEGQRNAAIRTHEAGLAVVRPTIRNVPAAVVMEAGVPDELWMSDGRFEHIAGPAVVISRAGSARTQVSLENIACESVPTLAAYRGEDAQTGGAGERYVVDRYTHGLHLGREASAREVTTVVEARAVDELPAPVASDVPELPPVREWVNVRTLGVVGDGETDDTAALRAAVAGHRVLYFPAGLYNVTGTVRLRADTVLIGLHPGMTVINVPNETAAFAGEGGARAIIEAPAGGATTVTGIGVYGGERNPRAVGVLWRAGERSMVDDVRFHGGHGTYLPGVRGSRYGERERWNTQAASLWVRDGGGGVFKNIWTPNPHAKSGMRVSDTSTAGRVYAVSAEHHVEREVIVERAAGWRFYGLQFEEEREESPRALALEIEGCRDLVFANTFFYRVVSSFVAARYAATVADSVGVRFRNVHVYSNSKVSFDSSVYDAATGTEVRDPEFAALDLAAARAPALPGAGVAARVTKLAGGFENIAGAAAAPNGDVYFTDARANRVYRWSVERGRVEMVREIAERPEQLAFDRAGNLLVIAYGGEGTVLTFDPTVAGGPVRRLEPREVVERVGGTAILPVSRWSGDALFLEEAVEKPFAHYVSADGTTYIPGSEAFVRGTTTWGVKLAGLLRTFGVAPAVPGRVFYVTNELDLRTYAFDVRADGSLANPRVFVEEGGECVTVGADGNVYVAAGAVLVFNPAGERVGVIHVAGRATCLVFGGAGGRRLYVTARDSLYEVSFGE